MDAQLLETMPELSMVSDGGQGDPMEVSSCEPDPVGQDDSQQKRSDLRGESCPQMSTSDRSSAQDHVVFSRVEEEINTSLPEGGREENNVSQNLFEEEGERVEECEKEPLSIELQHGLRVLTELMAESNKSINWPFMDPVDAEKLGLYDYHDRIKKPMWIKRMKEKFDNQEYMSITEFVGDMRLMLENCYRYNGPDHYISKRGQKLETVMEQKLALLSREIREKTTVAATASLSAEDGVLIVGTSTRRRKILHGHDSSALLNQLRQEEKEREREARRLTILERQKEREAFVQELQDWEDSLFPGSLQQQKRACWEIAQIGHFIFLCSVPLNIGEVMHYELEHCFMMPRESSTMQRIMTALLSTPYQRTRLDKKPMMPYKVWEDKLRTRLRFWYRTHKENDKYTKKTMQKLGVEEKFFKVCGHKNPLEKKKFHELTFYQRVWIVKGLCDWCLETQESIQEAIEAQPIEEQRDYLLGFDADGYRYIHFPQFCGADLRIYRQKPFPVPQIGRPLLLEQQDSWPTSPIKKQSCTSSRKKKKKKKETDTPSLPLTPRLRDSRLRQNPRKIQSVELSSSEFESSEAVESGDNESDADEPPLKNPRVESLARSRRCREAAKAMMEASQSDTSRESTPTRTLRACVSNLLNGSRSDTPSHESTPMRNLKKWASLPQVDSRSSTPVDESVGDKNSLPDSDSRVSTPLMCISQSSGRSSESGSSAPPPVCGVTGKVFTKPGAKTSRKLDFDKEEYCEVDHVTVLFDEASEETLVTTPASNTPTKDVNHEQKTTECLNGARTKDICTGKICESNLRNGASKDGEQVEQMECDPSGNLSISPVESTAASHTEHNVLVNGDIDNSHPNCDVSPLLDHSSICCDKPLASIKEKERYVSSHCSVDLPLERNIAMAGCIEANNSHCETSQGQVHSEQCKCDSEYTEYAERGEVNSYDVNTDNSANPSTSLSGIKQETIDEGFGEELSDDECHREIKDITQDITKLTQNNVPIEQDLKGISSLASHHRKDPSVQGHVSDCIIQIEIVPKQENPFDRTVPKDVLQVKSETFGSKTDYSEVDHKALPRNPNNSEVKDKSLDRKAESNALQIQLEPVHKKCANTEVQVPGQLLKTETDDNKQPVDPKSLQMRVDKKEVLIKQEPLENIDPREQLASRSQVPVKLEKEGLEIKQEVSNATDKSDTDKTSIINKSPVAEDEESPEKIEHVEESSDEEELEEMDPEIGEFELIADSVDLLRKLVSQYGNQEPITVETGKKQRVITPPPRKRCVIDLHARLEFLLKELEPWESKLVAAHRKARIKMRKEQENYREEPEPKEDVWESEESVSGSSSEEESEEENQTADAALVVKSKQRTAKKQTPKLTQEEKDGELEEEELGISSRGRIRKRRIIPNNIEDQGLKKRKLTKENDHSPSPTPNILQRNKSSACCSGTTGKTSDLSSGVSLLKPCGQTVYLNTSRGPTPLFIQTNPGMQTLLAHPPALAFTTSSGNVSQSASLVSPAKLTSASTVVISNTNPHISRALANPAMVQALLQQQGRQVMNSVSTPSATVSAVKSATQLGGVNLTNASSNIGTVTATQSVVGNTAISKPGFVSTSPRLQFYNYNNVSQLPAAVFQQLLRAQGVKVKSISGKMVAAASSSPVTAVSLPGSNVTPAGMTALTKLIQSGILPQALQASDSQKVVNVQQANTSQLHQLNTASVQQGTPVQEPMVNTIKQQQINLSLPLVHQLSAEHVQHLSTGQEKQLGIGQVQQLGKAQVQQLAKAHVQQLAKAQVQQLAKAQIQQLAKAQIQSSTGQVQQLAKAQVQPSTGQVQQLAKAQIQPSTGQVQQLAKAQIQLSTGQVHQLAKAQIQPSTGQVQQLAKAHIQPSTGQVQELAKAQIQSSTGQVQQLAKAQIQSSTGQVQQLAKAQIQSSTGQVQQLAKAQIQQLAKAQVQQLAKAHIQPSTGQIQQLANAHIQPSTGQVQQLAKAHIQPSTGQVQQLAKAHIQPSTGQVQQLATAQIQPSTGQVQQLAKAQIQPSTGQVQQLKTGQVQLGKEQVPQIDTGQSQHTSPKQLVQLQTGQLNVARVQHASTAQTLQITNPPLPGKTIISPKASSSAVPIRPANPGVASWKAPSPVVSVDMLSPELLARLKDLGVQQSTLEANPALIRMLLSPKKESFCKYASNVTVKTLLERRAAKANEAEELEEADNPETVGDGASQLVNQLRAAGVHIKVEPGNSKSVANASIVHKVGSNSGSLSDHVNLDSTHVKPEPQDAVVKEQVNASTELGKLQTAAAQSSVASDNVAVRPLVQIALSKQSDLDSAIQTVVTAVRTSLPTVTLKVSCPPTLPQPSNRLVTSTTHATKVPIPSVPKTLSKPKVTYNAPLNNGQGSQSSSTVLSLPVQNSSGSNSTGLQCKSKLLLQQASQLTAGQSNQLNQSKSQPVESEIKLQQPVNTPPVSSPVVIQSSSVTAPPVSSPVVIQSSSVNVTLGQTKNAMFLPQNIAAGIGNQLSPSGIGGQPRTAVVLQQQTGQDGQKNVVLKVMPPTGMTTAGMVPGLTLSEAGIVPQPVFRPAVSGDLNKVQSSGLYQHLVLGEDGTLLRVRPSSQVASSAQTLTVASTQPAIIQHPIRIVQHALPTQKPGMPVVSKTRLTGQTVYRVGGNSLQLPTGTSLVGHQSISTGIEPSSVAIETSQPVHMGRQGQASLTLSRTDIPKAVLEPQCGSQGVRLVHHGSESVTGLAASTLQLAASSVISFSGTQLTAAALHNATAAPKPAITKVQPTWAPQHPSTAILPLRNKPQQIEHQTQRLTSPTCGQSFPSTQNSTKSVGLFKEMTDKRTSELEQIAISALSSGFQRSAMPRDRETIQTVPVSETPSHTLHITPQNISDDRGQSASNQVTQAKNLVVTPQHATQLSFAQVPSAAKSTANTVESVTTAVARIGSAVTLASASQTIRPATCTVSPFKLQPQVSLPGTYQPQYKQQQMTSTAQVLNSTQLPKTIDQTSSKIPTLVSAGSSNQNIFISASSGTAGMSTSPVVAARSGTAGMSTSPVVAARSGTAGMSASPLVAASSGTAGMSTSPLVAQGSLTSGGKTVLLRVAVPAGTNIHNIQQMLQPQQLQALQQQLGSLQGLSLTASLPTALNTPALSSLGQQNSLPVAQTVVQPASGHHVGQVVKTLQGKSPGMAPMQKQPIIASMPSRLPANAAVQATQQVLKVVHSTPQTLTNVQYPQVVAASQQKPLVVTTLQNKPQPNSASQKSAQIITSVPKNSPMSQVLGQTSTISTNVTNVQQNIALSHLKTIMSTSAPKQVMMSGAVTAHSPSGVQLKPSVSKQLPSHKPSVTSHQPQPTVPTPLAPHSKPIIKHVIPATKQVTTHNVTRVGQSRVSSKLVCTFPPQASPTTVPSSPMLSSGIVSPMQTSVPLKPASSQVSAQAPTQQTSPAKFVLYNINGQLVTAQGIPVTVSQGVVRPLLQPSQGSSSGVRQLVVPASQPVQTIQHVVNSGSNLSVSGQNTNQLHLSSAAVNVAVTSQNMAKLCTLVKTSQGNVSQVVNNAVGQVRLVSTPSTVLSQVHGHVTLSTSGSNSG